MSISIKSIGMTEIKYQTYNDKQKQLKARIQKLRDEGRIK